MFRTKFISLLSIRIAFLLSRISIGQVSCQLCVGMNQYDRCSPNHDCGCFQLVGADFDGICVHQSLIDCSELVACVDSMNYWCEPNYKCVHHPRGGNRPICYPIPNFNEKICPLLSGKRMHSLLRMTTQL